MTSNIHKSYESNLLIYNLLRTPIKPWIGTNLLKQFKVDVSKQVTKRMHNLIHKYGATIYYNGWANVARRPMLELMFACPSGDVFIGHLFIG